MCKESKLLVQVDNMIMYKERLKHSRITLCPSVKCQNETQKIIQIICVNQKKILELIMYQDKQQHINNNLSMYKHELDEEILNAITFNIVQKILRY